MNVKKHCNFASWTILFYDSMFAVTSRQRSV